MERTFYRTLCLRVCAQQVSNMFIMSLALADLTVGVIVMPISSAYAITGKATESEPNLRNGFQSHLTLSCRRLEAWIRGLPVLAVCGLHGLDGLHLQPFHPLPGPILVHHVPAEVPEEEDQEEGPHNDSPGLDLGLDVGGAGAVLAPHPTRGSQAVTR